MRNLSITKVWFNVMNLTGVESFLHGPWTVGENDCRIRYMLLGKRFAQELRAEKIEMVCYREHLGFGEEVLNGGHLMATQGNLQTLVLDFLHLLNRRLASIWKDDWWSEVKQRSDEGLESGKKGFLLLPPRGARDSLHDWYSPFSSTLMLGEVPLSFVYTKMPKSLKMLVTGMSVPSNITWGCNLNWAGSGVKSIRFDLSGAIKSFFPWPML
jgi:hypothetical protein